MTCNNCDKANDDDANYCVYCGNQFNEYVPKAKEESTAELEMPVEPVNPTILNTVAGKDDIVGTKTAQWGLLAGGVYFLLVKLIRRTVNNSMDLDKIEMYSDILYLLSGSTPWVLAFFAEGKFRLALIVVGAISLLFTFFI